MILGLERHYRALLAEAMAFKSRLENIPVPTYKTRFNATLATQLPNIVLCIARDFRGSLRRDIYLAVKR